MAACGGSTQTAVNRLAGRERQGVVVAIVVSLVALAYQAANPVQRSALGRILGRERMHFDLETAVAAYLTRPVE